MPNINRMIFFFSVRIWLPASCRTIYSISDGEKSDGENSLIHAPVAQINVTITLAICDADTQHNRVFFCIFLDFVLPDEIQNYCSIFIGYHQLDIYDYRLESVILM